VLGGGVRLLPGKKQPDNPSATRGAESKVPKVESRACFSGGNFRARPENQSEKKNRNDNKRRAVGIFVRRKDREETTDIDR